jgi:fibronectin-binding autotransporter adhesin
VQSWTWTNQNKSGLWTDTKNWSPEGTPEDGDEVTLPAADVWGNTDVNGPQGAPALSLSKLTLQGLTLYDGPFTVTESLTWSGGGIDTDITVSGAATVTGLDGSSSNPGIANAHTITISGSATIIGGGSTASPQFLIDTGSKLVNAGSLSLSGAGFGSAAGFGTVDNSGTVTVTGSSHTAAGDITITHKKAAQLIISAGGEFIVGGGTVLKLAGGTVMGAGTLQVGDGNGGEIDTVADTAVPSLVIGGNGTVAPGKGASMPSPTLPGVLTITKSLGWGHGAGSGEYSALLGHLVLAAGATGVIENTTYLDNGKVENAGHITVAAKATLSLEGGQPVILNTGTVTLSGTATVTGGSMTSTGLIEKTGTGVALLGAELTNRGSIAVSQGILRIGDSNWTIAGGTVALVGGRLEGPGLGSLVLTGGPEGGVLAGTGTVAATVTNGGWVEPTAPGLTVTEYSQQPNGNVALSSGAASTLLTLGGVNLSIDGSLWLLG